VKKVLKPYASPRVVLANSRLQALFDAIPFTDKQRIDRIPLKMEMTVAGVVGFVESFSYYQTYFKTDPQAAAALLASMMTRLLEEMGVSSPDTKLEFVTDYYCVLACKPQ
ncbi:putative methyltransferase DDB_G0268948, partial [Tachysurus ichikawai]